MADITVEGRGADAYRVTITEEDSATTHDVTVGAVDVARLAGGCPPEDLIVASFRFLLEREPKESILGRFDLMVIARYFPEYPAAITGYLQ